MQNKLFLIIIKIIKPKSFNNIWNQQFLKQQNKSEYRQDQNRIVSYVIYRINIFINII